MSAKHVHGESLVEPARLRGFSSRHLRPRIVCHMISSIDGRLLVERWTPPAAGIERTRLDAYYDEIANHYQADGWIAGRISMEKFLDGLEASAVRPAPRAVAAQDLRTHVADRRGRGLAVAIDPHGRVRYADGDAAGDHVVAVVGEAVPDRYLAELQEAGVSYVLAGPHGTDLAGALQTLRAAFGAETLLLEGGGRTNGAFLEAGLIDEISLLVYPGIDGLSGIPSIFEYVGAAGARPAQGCALRHMATETLDGGVVWLRYSVEAAPDAASGDER